MEDFLYVCYDKGSLESDLSALTIGRMDPKTSGMHIINQYIGKQADQLYELLTKFKGEK